MSAIWVADGLAQYLRSPMWTTPISNFVDENCIFFNSDVEMKLEYTTIHKQFQELVDALLTGYIGELGVAAEEALEVIKASTDETHKRLVEYLTYLDDFTSFKKLMEKRNAELEYEALKQLNLTATNAEPTTAPAAAQAAEDDEGYSLALDESRRMAELIMKEAELEDLELQKVLALSLAMEQERVLREKEAAANAKSAESSAAPAPAPVPTKVETQTKSAEVLQQETMEARVKNLEEATKKVAELQASPAKVASPTAAPTPAPTLPTTTAATADPNAPAVVRLTATTSQTAATTGGLAPIGRKPLADPTSFKVLPSISFKQLQESTPAPVNSAPTAVVQTSQGPSAEEMRRRAEDLKKQRDLIIAMKKKERNEELEAATGQAPQPTPSTRDEEIARQKQMAVDIARRFREDLVGESRK